MTAQTDENRTHNTLCSHIHISETSRRLMRANYIPCDEDDDR